MLAHTQAIHPYARVLCCLEVAPSLRKAYESGSLSALLRQLLPLLILLDDNGKLDMYRFAHLAYPAGELGPEDFESFLAETEAYFEFGKSPDYQAFIQKIRSTYLRHASSLEDRKYLPNPLLVVCITQGQTQNQEAAIEELVAASDEPIFWVFISVPFSGARRSLDEPTVYLRRPPADAPSFLQYLVDHLPGRYLDNVHYFHLEHPDEVTQEVLLEQILHEYSHWLSQVKKLGLIGE
ncbi:MAG: hypothetical protein OHK0053_27000 [Microscillaceae bacterium]